MCQSQSGRMVGRQVLVIMTDQMSDFEVFFKVSRGVFSVVLSLFQHRCLVFSLNLYKPALTPFIC